MPRKLPGPQMPKYVKQWPKASEKSPKGQYSAYIKVPGSFKAHLVLSGQSVWCFAAGLYHALGSPLQFCLPEGSAGPDADIA